MRAHGQYFRDGVLMPGVFRAHGAGMSVDWGKYSTAEETRARAKDPERNSVLRIPVSGIRQVKPLDVIHSPDHERANRAHCDVPLPASGEDLTEVRRLLLGITQIAIA